MIRPPAGSAAGREEARQLARGVVAQGDQIDRLAPGGRFLGAAGLRHLADDARQHVGRMLPADHVETLERLVDEVERVPAIRVGAVRLGREQQVRELGRRCAARNRGQHGALGRLAMAHRHPAPQPALQRGEVGPARERRALPARRRTVAVLGHAPRAVKQRELRFLARQHRQQLAERGQDGEPDAPAIAVAAAEQRGLPHDVRRRPARREQAMHRLGDDEAQVVREPVGEPPAPMFGRIGIAEHRLDPDFAAARISTGQVGTSSAHRSKVQPLASAKRA